MRSKAQRLLGNAGADVPLHAFAAPVLEPLGRVVGRHEILELHLLELARAEHEVARRDLIAKRLANLSDAERRLLARRLQHVEKVHEHALRRFRPEVSDTGFFLDWSDE